MHPIHYMRVLPMAQQCSVIGRPRVEVMRIQLWVKADNAIFAGFAPYRRVNILEWVAIRWRTP